MPLRISLTTCISVDNRAKDTLGTMGICSQVTFLRYSAGFKDGHELITAARSKIRILLMGPDRGAFSDSLYILIVFLLRYMANYFSLFP